jgi:calcineurin-like phosphoesterase family protein
MINIINQTVGENGILLHLGDFCLNTTLQQYINILTRLKISELWMINGNHNNPHRSFDHSSVSYINYKILRLNDYFTFRHKRKIFTCLHYPMAIWDGMGIGAMHLCGHSHGSYRLSRPEDLPHKILDCGWCIHKKPLSLKVIDNIMLKKGIDNLHHA